MTILLFALLALLAFGSVTLLLWTRMRILDSASRISPRVQNADRYRPMLRLLSDEDLKVVGMNSKMRATMRERRRSLFRRYLRCLAKEYAGLLSGIRHLIVESGTDRPDLAKALAKNRFMFAVALCRIEVNLQLHAFGVGKVDVSGLVEALDGLRGAARTMTPVAGAAY